MKVTNNGSFPWRGTALGEALEGVRGDAGRSETAWREARDRVARQALAAQAEAGCDLVTDGLARRDETIADVVAGLAGCEIGAEKTGLPPAGARYRVPIVRGELSWKEPILVEDYLFAAGGSPVPVKVVLTGPFTIAHLAEDHAYGEPMALAMAMATALNQELRALQAAGATFIQVDEPGLLARPESFPIFTRVWEVLGRGVGATLAIHLEGGSIAPIAVGLGRLKRLGCLSIDCVTHPENLEAAAAAPRHDGATLALGIASGRAGDPGDASAMAERLRGLPGLPDSARLMVGTASDLGGLSFEAAAERLRWLAEVRRRFDA